MAGVVFLRSSGATFLSKVRPNKPAFVGACTNPKDLGAIQNLDAPEGNITGVTYFIPYEKRIEAIRSVFPNVKKLALVAEKGHPATPIEQQGTRLQCERLGMAYTEVIAANLEDLAKGIEDLSGKVDLFVLASTSLVIDNVPTVRQQDQDAIVLVC